MTSDPENWRAALLRIRGGDFPLARRNLVWATEGRSSGAVQVGLPKSGYFAFRGITEHTEHDLWTASL